MVVVRGVLVPLAGIWNAVCRHAHGRGGRGTVCRGGPWVLPEDGWSAQSHRSTLEPCAVLAPGDSYPGRGVSCLYSWRAAERRERHLLLWVVTPLGTNDPFTKVT